MEIYKMSLLKNYFIQWDFVCVLPQNNGPQNH